MAECFKVLDSAKSTFVLLAKRSNLHQFIGCLQPELNAQLQYNNNFCFSLIYHVIIPRMRANECTL